ncbi:hypothetical protein Lal_00015662 [Lupinus albus]|nr:hypothetical protein Lal_00015662 [Lupinus albus]
MREFGLQQTIPQDNQTSTNFIRWTYVAKMNTTGHRNMKFGFKCGRVGNSAWSTMFLTLNLCITTRTISYIFSQFNFTTELIERTAAPQSYNNPIQIIDCEEDLAPHFGMVLMKTPTSQKEE